VPDRAPTVRQSRTYEGRSAHLRFAVNGLTALRAASQKFALRDGDDLGDFGDFFPEVAFDAHLEGHGAGGAAVAGAVEADLDDAGGSDVHQLDVASIGLDSWADEVDDGLDFFADGWGGGCG